MSENNSKINEAIKNHKKVLAFVVCLLLFTTILPWISKVEADAEVIVDSGICGENVVWELDDAGVLTISGVGKMDDFEYDAISDSLNSPWVLYKNQVKTIVIKNGVKSIGEDAFVKFKKLEKVTMASSVESIGEQVFLGCTKLSSIQFPKKLNYIGEGAFYRSRNTERRAEGDLRSFVEATVLIK